MHRPTRTSTIASAGAILALLLAAAPAAASRGHLYAGSFNGEAGGPLARFTTPNAVALAESSGEVYVLDSAGNRVEWFNPTGARLLGSFNAAATPALTFSQPDAIAIDNTCSLHERTAARTLSAAECRALDPSDGDVYVADSGHAVIDKFTAQGEYITQITGTCPSPGRCRASETIPFPEMDGLAVDANGRLLAATSQHGANGHVDVFSDDREAIAFLQAPPTVVLGATQRPGFAVDSSGELYASFEEPFAEEAFIARFAADGTPLNTRLASLPLSERVPAAPPSGLAAETPSGHIYFQDATAITRLDASGATVEQLGAGQLSSSGGLAVDSASGTIYATDPAAHSVAVFTPEPSGAPSVTAEPAANVLSDRTKLEAAVNPRGASTTLTFRYGACPTLHACPASGYGPETPVMPAGSDFASHRLATTIAGLTPGTVYHFRALARNETAGSPHTVEGAEETFTTPPDDAALTLPDARRWELVSPASKHGAQISTGGSIQAAADGHAITYPASGPVEPAPEGFTGAVQVLSNRQGGRWSSAQIAVPHTSATGYSPGRGAEYRLSSQDLTEGILQPFGAFTALSPEADEQTAYLRQNTTGSYRPLVSAADVAPHTVFGGEHEGHCEEPSQVACGPKFRGGTPDLSHIVISSPAALTEGAPTGGQDLYEWGAGSLTLLGQAAGEPGAAFHAISSDGTRVIFDGSSEGQHGLLLRDATAGQTVTLDAAEPACLDRIGVLLRRGPFRRGLHRRREGPVHRRAPSDRGLRCRHRHGRPRRRRPVCL